MFSILIKNILGGIIVVNCGGMFIMAVNLEFYMNRKMEEIELDSAVLTEDLYDYVADERLQYIFAVLHQELNRLINFMYSKTNMHFNANESRQLLHYIKFYEDLKYMLRNTDNAFEIDTEYSKFLEKCKKFLVASNGSTIPEDLVHIELKEYEPIFHFISHIEVVNPIQSTNYSLIPIGEGSYAKVFRYTDEFYNLPIALKRAKSNLTNKEIERFRKEFDIMNSLNSPYVLNVYKYNDKTNEYCMEYVDQTLYDYIRKNNQKLTLQERYSIVMQVLRGFRYIHSKEILHRDISLTNILVKKYDDIVRIKISDFGLVKEKNSNLTSLESEIKGSLNDESNLRVVGFANYKMWHETFALTRLILYVLTGRLSLDKVSDETIREFVLKGTNGDIAKRFMNVEELEIAFKKLYKGLI